jgi:hypothetical protein
MKSCTIRFDRVAHDGDARRLICLMPNSNSEVSIANITIAAIAKSIGDCAKRGIPTYNAIAENTAKTEKIILSGAYRQIARIENDAFVSLDCWLEASKTNITMAAIAKNIGICAGRVIPGFKATAADIAKSEKTLVRGSYGERARFEYDEFISLVCWLDVGS